MSLVEAQRKDGREAKVKAEGAGRRLPQSSRPEVAADGLHRAGRQRKSRMPPPVLALGSRVSRGVAHEDREFIRRRPI